MVNHPEWMHSRKQIHFYFEKKHKASEKEYEIYNQKYHDIVYRTYK